MENTLAILTGTNSTVFKLNNRLGRKVAVFLRTALYNGFANTVRNTMGFLYNNCFRRGDETNAEASTYQLYTHAAQFPLHCRANSSDPKVFYQVFMEQEYSVLKGLEDVRLIIDCGANVGYSAAYFLSLYPKAKLIAVEPDSANFALLERNMKPYGDRVELHMAGIWSHSTGLTLCRGEYRDGAEWATQVRESRAGEQPDVQAIDIGMLLRQSGCETVDMLKIDIERSESIVFAGGYEEWLSKTRNIAIELHDDECKNIFNAAIARYSFACTSNENVVCCKTY